jgi:glutamyl/glutaminyl-tRNA synthetase
VLDLPRDKLEVAVASVRNGMETLTDAVEPMDLFVRPAGDVSSEALDELRGSLDLDEAIGVCLEVLRANRSSDRETAERIVTILREEAKSRGWGAKKVLWPLRLAVTGLTVGPDLVYLIMFWGPDGCAGRIEAAKRTLGEQHE